MVGAQKSFETRGTGVTTGPTVNLNPPSSSTSATPSGPGLTKDTANVNRSSQITGVWANPDLALDPNPPSGMGITFSSTTQTITKVILPQSLVQPEVSKVTAAITPTANTPVVNGCYKYMQNYNNPHALLWNSLFGAIPTTPAATFNVPLMTSGGQAKTISVAHQNPPTILQDMYFIPKDPYSYCRLFLTAETPFYSGGYPIYSANEPVVQSFLTTSGTVLGTDWKLGVYWGDIYTYGLDFSWLNIFFVNPFKDIVGTPSQRMVGEDKVINHIAQNGVVVNRQANHQILWGYSNYNNPLGYYYVDSSAPATNCQKISGNGPRKVVFMRGKSWDSGVNDYLLQVDNVITNGFKKIDPFKTYADQFSFYVDLKKYDETAFQRVPAPGGGVMFSQSATQSLMSSNSCTGVVAGDQYLFYGGSSSGFERGIAYNKSKFAMFNISESTDASVAIHETGHAFAGLWDEYADLATQVKPANIPDPSENCSSRPGADFKDANNRVYGSVNTSGCGYLYSSSLPLVRKTYYRPSPDSLMNLLKFGSDERFNVISCGYVVAAIKGESLTKLNAQKYWPECLGMANQNPSTINKDGILPVAPVPTINSVTKKSTTSLNSGSSIFAQIFQGAKSALLAAVGAANSISLTAGESLTVSGSGFTTEDNTAQLVSTANPSDTYEVLNIASSDQTIIYIEVPKTTPAGTYQLKIGAFNSPWSPVVATLSVAEYVAPRPTITAFDHNATHPPGSWVIVTGSGFSTSTIANTDKVQFSGPQTREITAGIAVGMTMHSSGNVVFNGDFYIDPIRPNLVKGQYTAFQIPATTTPGTYTVKIANQGSPWSNSLSFTVLPAQNSDGSWNPSHAIAMQSPPDVVVSREQPNVSVWTADGLYSTDVGVFKYLAWTTGRTNSSLFFGKTNTHLVSASSTKVGYTISGEDTVNYYATNFLFSSSTAATNFLSTYLADMDAVPEGGAHRISDANFRGIIWKSGANIIFLHANLNSSKGQDFLNQVLPIYSGRFPPPVQPPTTPEPSFLQTIVGSVVGAVASVINNIVDLVSPPAVMVSAPIVENPSPEIITPQEESTVTVLQIGPTHKSSLTDGVGGAHLDRPVRVFVSGDYAYVIGYGGTLEIMNISSSTNPIHEGSLAHGVGGAVLDTPTSLFVLGDYAYVTSHYDTLEIVDISDKSNPVHEGKITNGTGGAILQYPNSVFVSGNYAYVTSFAGDALEIVDISNPTAPIHKGKIVHGIGGALLHEPTSVFVRQNYAYIAVLGSNALEIVDVIDPANPVHVSSLVNGSNGATLYGPNSIFVKDRYAYLSVLGSKAVEIVDIANPVKPIHKGKIAHGAGGALLDAPTDIFVSGDYAYLSVAGASDALEIVDVSDPANPVHKGSLSNMIGGAILNNPSSLVVSGDYVYTVSRESNALEIIYFPRSALAPVGGSGGASAYGQSFVPTFTLSANPSVHQVSFISSSAPSKTFVSQVNISRTNFSGEVSLRAESVDMQPEDYSVTFDRQAFAAGSSNPVTVTVVVNRSVSTGTKTVQIIGTGAAATPVSVEVKFNVRQVNFENY